jgi:hypothetical protein
MQIEARTWTCPDKNHNQQYICSPAQLPVGELRQPSTIELKEPLINVMPAQAGIQ